MIGSTVVEPVRSESLIVVSTAVLSSSFFRPPRTSPLPLPILGEEEGVAGGEAKLEDDTGKAFATAGDDKDGNGMSGTARSSSMVTAKR